MTSIQNIYKSVSDPLYPANWVKASSDQEFDFDVNLFSPEDIDSKVNNIQSTMTVNQVTISRDFLERMCKIALSMPNDN